MPNLVSGAPDSFDGHRIYINQDMPVGAAAKGILFGDLSKYLIRDVMNIKLVRLDERYAEKLQTAFFMYQDSDGALLDAGTNPVKYMTLA